MSQDDNTVENRQTRGEPRILFVHGRKPKPPETLYRPQLWRCLLEGVRRADPDAAAALEAKPECFTVVNWHDLFYERDRDIGQDLDAIERLLAQPGPTQADISEARSWRRRLKRAAYHLADRFPWLMTHFADPWIRETVDDTLRYLEDRNTLASRVRERVIAALSDAADSGERLLVIGHSLGSVVVYDSLWLLSRERGRPVTVDRLITIGSPLGTRFIQKRLLGFRRKDASRFPQGIRRWHNLATVGDLAALDPEVADDFGPMIDQGLLEVLEDNTRAMYGSFRGAAGLNVHRSYGYLVQPAVGALIADWWRQGAGGE